MGISANSMADRVFLPLLPEVGIPYVADRFVLVSFIGSFGPIFLFHLFGWLASLLW
jgi:hypothetical protein